ncbi:MAG: hypothetical protein SGARI_008301, partial [Bacillariaceae sp.]
MSMEVSRHDTIGKVKEMIEKKKGVRSGEFVRLCYPQEYKNLDDNLTVSHCNIPKEATIHYKISWNRCSLSRVRNISFGKFLGALVLCPTGLMKEIQVLEGVTESELTGIVHRLYRKAEVSTVVKDDPIRKAKRKIRRLRKGLEIAKSDLEELEKAPKKGRQTETEDDDDGMQSPEA